MCELHNIIFLGPSYHIQGMIATNCQDLCFISRRKLISISGFIFYFSYGIRHSKAGDAQNRNFLHHPRRPTHLNLTPIIPETETTSNRNSGSSSIIRFSDNTNNRKSSFSDARYLKLWCVNIFSSLWFYFLSFYIRFLTCGRRNPT